MKRLYKKNKKVAIVFSLVMCLVIVVIGTVTSNASMNRYDEWMKKYLEYRTANKDLSNDQIAAMVDKEMCELQKSKETTVVEPETTLCPGDMTKPTVTETPDAVTIPAITPEPELKEGEKGSVSPCDCEECIAFYQIYQ